MAIVAGVDFGTLSVRVSIVDSERGLLGFRAGGISAPSPPRRSRIRHPVSRRSHERSRDCDACGRSKSGRPGQRPFEAIALDTTGSSVVPVDKNLQPLDDYYLWCDHRAKSEAAEITAAAHREKLPAIDWCGGIYSSEWGFSKLLHWLRHNPEKRADFASAFEHCDMVAATLCGITDPRAVKRSICAMGHKWLWNESLGGLPPESFLVNVDPLFAGVREKLSGTTPPPTRSPESSRRNGRKNSAFAPAFPFPSAHSTRTGTPSARAAAAKTWSTSSAPPPASSASRRRSNLFPVFAALSPAAFIPSKPASKRASPPSAIFSTPSPPAPAPTSRLFRKVSKPIAPVKPVYSA